MDGQKKILIVDDEKPMARALQLKLDHNGFETKVVYQGTEALRELEKEKFHLVVLDLMMPNLDGFGVLKELQKRGSTVPVVVTSNLSQSEDEKRALALGAQQYFVKSNTPLSKIVDYVKKILKV